MIAYFCAEYALHRTLRTYAGGLGILAGDTVYEAGESGEDIVFVGLYYYKGYLTSDFEWYPPESAGLTLVTDSAGHPVTVTVPIGSRDVHIRAWSIQQGTVTVYMLDTVMHENHPDDQKISHHLYDPQEWTRLAQQLVLGIGGVLMLHKLGIHPHLYHMNEGHAVFLTLAKDPSTPVVFTNHTVVAAGNHMYSTQVVRASLERYASSHSHIDMEQLLYAGRCQYEDTFSLAHYGVRVCARMNGVSMLHSEKLREIYHIPIYNVTNGISLTRWDRVADASLISTHLKHKHELIDYISTQTGSQMTADSLIVTWARRLAQYKRPLALFEDRERLMELLSRTDVDVRCVIAGIPHPRDTWACAALETILDLTASSEYRGKIIYLPGYDTHLAQLLTSGSDVWLNTPIVGLEACGTSGMKAALHGALTLSTADGWMAEAPRDEMGWELNDAMVARSIHTRLTHDVIPAWIQRDRDGRWYRMMERSREIIMRDYSARRMLRDYHRHMWTA